MPIIIPANSAASGGFNVDNSVRLDGTSAYLYKVNPGTSSTNNKRGTISCWVKKWGFPDNSIYLINAQNNDQERFIIQISNGDQIIGSYRNADGTNDVDISTSLDRVYRDPAAWFNVVVAWNTSDGTGGNRMKLYVNGEEQGLAFSTDIAQNSIFPLNVPNYNSSYPITIGRNFQGGNAANYLPAYLAEFCFVDGQTLDGTSFGEFDEDSGIWKPIDVSGLTFGGLGWHLQFENSGALGTDSNDNGTWTTAGLAAIDQTQDTCTNNFATLNPLIYESRDNTFAEGNLKITGGGSDDWVNKYGVSNFAVSSGKWFVEAKMTTVVGSQGMLGIMGTSTALVGSMKDNGPANIDAGGRITGGGNNIQTGLTNFANGNIAGAAFDATNGTIQFYRNGSAYGNAVSSIASDTYYFVTNSYDAGAVVEFNFGSPPYSESGGNSDGDGFGNFSMAVPSGYFALNTKNLAEYG